jgi:hypothetical protein
VESKEVLANQTCGIEPGGVSKQEIDCKSNNIAKG